MDIWKEPAYRKLQGTFPVISLSFSSIKEKNYEEAKEKICATIQMLYQKYRFLLEGETLNEQEKTEFNQVSSGMREYVQDSLASLGAGFGSALADIIHLRIPAQPRGAYIRWGIDTRH